MSQIDIVIPDGSMHKIISTLFEKAGLPITKQRRRINEGMVDVDWIQRIAFQRPQEIPNYLHNGHFDVAVVGEDWIANWGYDFPVLLKLPIGRSGNKFVRIVLAVHQDSDVQQVNGLPRGCEIATEYVQLTERFLADQGRSDIKVVSSFGNTEHKIGFGATAIVDVTESGDSLEAHHLKIICEIMESHTVVVANPMAYADQAKLPYINCLTRLLKGAHQASQYVIILANVPSNLVKTAGSIMQGLKGPTRSPLIGISDWFSLQSVVARDQEQKVVFELLQLGVTDIIVNRDIPLIMF